MLSISKIKNTILYLDVSDNCSAEAINGSMLNLLDNKLNIQKVLLKTNDLCLVKIIKHPYTTIYFLEMQKYNRSCFNNIKDIFFHVVNMEINSILKINAIRILKAFIFPILYEVNCTKVVKNIFFKILRNAIRHTIVFSHLVHNINPDLILYSTIPLSLFNYNSLFKKWILNISLGVSIKLLNTNHIPCDPLGIAFIKSIVSSIKYYDNSMTLIKIGYGTSINNLNKNNVCRSLWLRKKYKKIVNFISKIDVLKITVFIDLCGEYLKSLTTLLAKSKYRFYSSFVNSNDFISLYKMDVFIPKSKLNSLLKTFFIYGFCQDIYIQTSYKYHIIENIIRIPVDQNLSCRVKEYIFNNKIVAVKPYIHDMLAITNLKHINIQLNIAKLLIQWELLRLDRAIKY
jgi:hypothetical protein